MSATADTYQDMALRIEPDVQATLSDFLTYTEHFPAQLTRALTLIQSETKRAERRIASIHADTLTYSQLPKLSGEERKDPRQLRKDISYALEKAERAGRMRLEEASRLRELAIREEARLKTLVTKLKAIPIPSRDPTPEDDGGALASPNATRTAHFGPDVAPDKTPRRFDKSAALLRARKIIVPGEVIAPLDPNAPQDTFSDWSSDESTPPPEEMIRKHTPRPRSRTPRLPKYDRYDREDREKKSRPRGPRLPGQPGTNAHSAVAGISTSNALLALNPPPPDALQGSKWYPWVKLTEWELATLRKRMKKNAIWVPSATMVRRELKQLGRGVSVREAERAAAEAEGRAFIDEHNEPDPTKLVPGGAPNAEPTTIVAPAVPEEDEDADAELINRGMRLNEAKKLKRARLLEEQREASAQIAREQADESPEAGVVKSESNLKKRKREEQTPIKQQKDVPLESPDQLAAAGPPPRRLKLNHTTASAPGEEPLISIVSKSTGRRKTSTPPPTQRKSTIILKANKAVSEEPPNRRAGLRRSSNVSLPDTATTSQGRIKTAGRRNKRPAPGVITGGDEESAKVSASRRKAAPRKRTSGAQAKQSAVMVAPDPQADEEIDPDEPRYCICGDVSWGTMIQCENELSCEKEWFHLPCVNLTELPPRRTKWFCPDCRKKLKLGQTTNGLVGKVPAAPR